MSRILVPILLSSVIVAAAAAQDAPQPTRSVNFGMLIAPGNLSRGDRGAVMSGAFEPALSNRFGLRVQGMLAYISSPPPIVYAVGLCAVDRPCPPKPSDVAVAGASASGRYDLDSPDGGTYITAGLGAYYFLSDPTRRGALRPGVTTGFGYELRVGQIRLALDANYQLMFRDRGGQYWLLPVTLGIRF